MPTSSSALSRPRTRATPAVGAVIRARIRSSVVLPAPLRPMMPTSSPLPTVNDTSCSAQKSSPLAARRPRIRFAMTSVSSIAPGAPPTV